MSLVMMLPVLGFAQGNGGITNENASAKIEWIGMSPNGSYVVKVTNKQTCQASMRVQWNGNTQSNSKQIPATLSDTFWMPPNPASGGFLRAKPETVCSSSDGDIGAVELNVNQILPVKFSSIVGQRVGPNSIKLTFVSEEDAATDHYNIQYSLDGKVYKTATVLFPNGIEGKKTYSVIIKY